MIEYENEPIPGLPGLLPPGESILWQGSPDWRVLARTAFHTRMIAGYFAVLLAFAAISAAAHGVRSSGDLLGVAMTLGLGTVGVTLLHVLAWGSARTTIYTLTDRRIVLRIGIAVPKCINLPLVQIGAVDLALWNEDAGDLPLTIVGPSKLGFLALWPHARPWRIAEPQPMLRAVPGAANVAALIARTCLAVNSDGRPVAAEAQPRGIPALAQAAAA